jgi:hypothetical protein
MVLVQMDPADVGWETEKQVAGHQCGERKMTVLMKTAGNGYERLL